MSHAMAVAGHEAVEARFTEAMAQGRLHHAWLLYGLKGIGKHMLAEKLAGIMVCEHHSACGRCHGCLMLAAGSHPDVYRVALIEGKRDVNIEQVREMLAFLALSTSQGERRIVILDDAERMNNQAANALLKGLEEPAAGSMLLMVCADLMRLPATIRSRCMLQQCTPLADETVRGILSLQLGDDVTPEQLTLATELAKGCPGTVHSLQDKKVAGALLSWRQLVHELAQADIGMLENWIGQFVAMVPHDLIISLLLAPVYPRLQQAGDAKGFVAAETLHQAAHACARWPADVVRSSLRAGPTLLAHVMTLRAALRSCSQSGR
ncbi:AAA family ATPase [Mariprofundus erugo]|uniref:AAA family ATPase n=1 Tax=Mariprofundus erugo TaxID=2528639 RepID=A0A5R9GM06_9PROT|nr:AAA family ATPase [Mariprofundus erugo]TLS66155.1 AAA family ATPase [Mariprofundus erugo]